MRKKKEIAKKKKKKVKGSSKSGSKYLQIIYLIKNLRLEYIKILTTQ